MKGLRILDRRAGFSLGAVVVLLGMVAPAVMPAFASASTLTSRSIQMSTAEQGVSADYTVNFEPTATGESDVVLLFCSDTGTGSLEGTTCTAPASMSMTSATVDAAASTDTSAAVLGTPSANGYTVKANLVASEVNTIVINGVLNPDTANTTFYARIETFSDTTGESDAEAAQVSGTTTTGIEDFGGVALTTSSTIGVNATVAESMTFCVAGAAPAAGCSGTLTSPAVNLGTDTNGIYLLGAGGATSTATDYAQMSTNANGGAVVYLKSDASSCGGLYIAAESDRCGILPASTSGQSLATGAGEFGLTVGSTAGETGGSTPSGVLCPETGYDATHPYINYESGNSTGVTSAYGSPLLESGSDSSCTTGFTAGPVSNEYVPVEFYANAAPNTPAGEYSANLNMIAVGTF